MYETLDDASFLLYAAKNYDNPQAYDVIEFYDDLKRFKYLKRLFGKYQETGELRERLVLNHIIILYNVFGPEATTRMLFYKLDAYYSYLKPFFILLGYMPERVYLGLMTDTAIRSEDIVMDENIVKILRNL